jgi:ketosteroid isomerase-like protein
MTTTDRQMIDRLFATMRQGLADHDPGPILAAYAPDALLYDLAPPLLHRGMKRDETAAWLATWSGPIRLEDHDLDLVLVGDLAVATALSRMRGRQAETEQDLWFRSTRVLRRLDGWRIVHEHTSVPFYMDGSYRAAVDLKPEEG